jgi:hypothetical protein
MSDLRSPAILSPTKPATPTSPTAPKAPPQIPLEFRHLSIQIETSIGGNEHTSIKRNDIKVGRSTNIRNDDMLRKAIDLSTKMPRCRKKTWDSTARDHGNSTEFLTRIQMA